MTPPVKSQSQSKVQQVPKDSLDKLIKLPLEGANEYSMLLIIQMYSCFRRIPGGRESRLCHIMSPVN